MKTVLILASMLLLIGCGTVPEKYIDLGDGKIFKVVPTGPAFKVAGRYLPGSEQALNLIEAQLKQARKAKFGPFNGLPYTEQTDVILKSGTEIPKGTLRITAEQIDKYLTIQSPVVPAAIITESRPVTTIIPTNTPVTLSDIIDWSAETNVSLTDAMNDALNNQDENPDAP